jgi:transposase
MYPIDRRRVAFIIYSELQSSRKTATLLQVCHTTVSRWLRNQVKQARKKHTNKVWKADMIVNILRTTIQNDPFISIAKLRALILQSLNLNVSKELVRICIKRIGMTKKKAKFYGDPPNLKAKTDDFIAQRDKYLQEGKVIYSIDETSFGRNGIENRGYSAIGKRLFIRKKAARMTTTSVIACCTDNAWIKTSPLKGSTNTAVFLAFLESINIPENTVLLMDNVSFHHSKVIKEFVKSKGAFILYSPPYSPWFNPIEMCFSIVKKYFREQYSISDCFGKLETRHFKAFFNKSLQCVGNF